MTKFSFLNPASYNLKTRFALVSVVLFIFSVWGLAGYVAYELEHDMEELLAEQQRAMASSIAQAIRATVRLRRESLLTTSAKISPEVLRHRRALTKLLEQLVPMHQLFDVALIVTTPAGQVLAEYPARPGQQNARFSQRGLVSAINERKQFSIGSPVPGQFSKAAAISFGAPILGRSNEELGVLYGITSLHANEFVDQATDITSDIGYLVIAQKSRLILAAKDKSRIMQAAAPIGDNPLLDRFLEGYEGSGISVNFRGTEELSSGKRVQGTDWVVVITMPKEEVFAPVVEMRERIFYSAAILSLLVALLTWLFVQGALKPLEQFIKSVHKMGTPESPLRHLDIAPSGPEIGKLVEAFNRMQQRIAVQAAVLCENEARFHFVADHSPMLIWISDEAGRRIWFNQTWLMATSLSMEQLHAGKWIDGIHPDDRAGYIALVERAMAVGKPVRAKFRLRDASGAYRWFLEMAVPRFADGNKLAGYVGSCLDIDEQVAAQFNSETLLSENRKLMAERFTVEEDERRRMARDLHDDLGQWLTAISANAEAICSNSSGEGQEKIFHCAASIITSTSAIQDFVRAMNRRLGSNTLATLGLKESLVEFMSAWRKDHTDIVTEMALDDDLGAMGKHLEVTVMHLVQEGLTNVARHAKASRVRLDLRRLHVSGDDELLLSIIDDGIGFAAVSDSPGVGLIGMRERAVALGGRCTIRTAPNNGTAVEVRIPLREEAFYHANDSQHANS